MDDKLTKRLENIRTELTKIPQDVLDRLVESLQRHSYSARLDAHHSVRSILGSGGSCSKTDILILSGRDKTDSSGKATLAIESLLCGVVHENLRSDTLLVMIREPQFVATAVSSLPVVVTAVTRSTQGQLQPSSILVDRDNNQVGSTFLASVAVEVATWRADSNPAARTVFSWICTVEAARLIAFG